MRVRATAVAAALALVSLGACSTSIESVNPNGDGTCTQRTKKAFLFFSTHSENLINCDQMPDGDE